MNDVLKMLDTLIEEKLMVSVKSKSRKKTVVNGKFIFSHIAKNIFSIKVCEIARYCGKTHASVINDIKKCDNFLSNEIEFFSDYENIINSLDLTPLEVLIKQYNFHLKKLNEYEKDLSKILRKKGSLIIEKI